MERRFLRERLRGAEGEAFGHASRGSLPRFATEEIVRLPGSLLGTGLRIGGRSSRSRHCWIADGWGRASRKHWPHSRKKLRLSPTARIDSTVSVVGRALLPVDDSDGQECPSYEDHGCVKWRFLDDLLSNEVSALGRRVVQIDFQAAGLAIERLAVNVQSAGRLSLVPLAFLEH